MGGQWPHPCITPCLWLFSRGKRVFSRATNNHRTITLALFRKRRVGCQLLRAGCQFHVHLPLGKICGKLYIFIVVSFSKSRKRKKKKTMNINSKRKKNPGKEIKHFLFFIVGKVAILSTFFFLRGRILCTLKFERWKNCIQSSGSGVDFVPYFRYGRNFSLIRCLSFFNCALLSLCQTHVWHPCEWLDWNQV